MTRGSINGSVMFNGDNVKTFSTDWMLLSLLGRRHLNLKCAEAETWRTSFSPARELSKI
jgi:hypothetical protein